MLSELKSSNLSGEVQVEVDSPALPSVVHQEPALIPWLSAKPSPQGSITSLGSHSSSEHQPNKPSLRYSGSTLLLLLLSLLLPLV
jgi:hypothetical protein